jgi:TolA-binding protein
MKRIKFIFLSLVFLGGCAYYNTFFNAEENYRLGLEKKESNRQEKLPESIKKYFNTSIAKSWKVIDLYGDSSAWADNALIMVGKSYYQLEEYDKSQEVLEQFLQKYLKSELIPEAELWLAKTYLKQEDDEQALSKFSGIISKTDDDEIRAEALLNLGELYFKSENYKNAIERFSECIDATSNSERAGKAQYKLADSYYQLKNYESAIENYEEVLRYDLPIIKQYDAVIQVANSLLELKKYERAQEILQTTLRDQRFKKQYSMIATKLANMIEFQGDLNFAIEKYREVLKKYPKTDGSALAAFYMAQIYEFEYGVLDSAKVKYDRVKKEYSRSESAEEAAKRSRILADYLKIKKQLLKDKDDMYKLEHGDSSLVDSLVSDVDTLLISIEDTLKTQPLKANGRQIAKQLSKIKKDTVKQQKKIRENKVAVSRDPEVVEKSLLKNDFRMAEYFLVNYQHYDSAKVAYTHFVNNYSDSLLIPKAYYSLYYISKDIDQDSVKADSFKTIILTQYPNTIYGRKLSGKTVVITEHNKEGAIKDAFLNAEKLFDEKKYNQAIRAYNTIAMQDSGSSWAIKSRYASAYLYENFIKNTDSAYVSYSILAKEYPKSPQGKIALSKIAEPPIETEEQISDSTNTKVSIDSTQIKVEQNKPQKLKDLQDATKKP